LNRNKSRAVEGKMAKFGVDSFKMFEAKYLVNVVLLSYRGVSFC